jgi:hypothetical protein
MSRRTAFLPSDFVQIGQYEWHQATHARRKSLEKQELIEAQAEIRELLLTPPQPHKGHDEDES